MVRHPISAWRDEHCCSRPRSQIRHVGAPTHVQAAPAVSRFHRRTDAHPALPQTSVDAAGRNDPLDRLACHLRDDVEVGVVVQDDETLLLCRSSDKEIGEFFALAGSVRQGVAAPEVHAERGRRSFPQARTPGVPGSADATPLRAKRSSQPRDRKSSGDQAPLGPRAPPRPIGRRRWRGA